jgi:hypothetical protein
MPTLRHFTAFVGAADVASTLGLAALSSASVASYCPEHEELIGA